MCYVVSNVFSPDAPTSLPMSDVVQGVMKLLKECAFMGTRLVLVVATWFVTVPLITTSFFRLAFARSLRAFWMQLRSRLGPTLVLFDCANGLFVSVCVIFLLTGLSTLRAYVKQLLMSSEDDAAGEGVAADGGARAQGEDGAAGFEGLPPRAVAANHDAGGGGGGGGDDEYDDEEDDDFEDDGFLPEEEFAAFDDLTLEQLIGLRGPLHRLFEHAAWLSVHPKSCYHTAALHLTVVSSLAINL